MRRWILERQHIVIPTEAPRGASWPTWHTAAWISAPKELRRSELRILVHGANSDHRYWDFPIDADRYSYVQWSHEHGIATLTIDRIGCGASSHPPGVENTIEAQVETLHRLVSAVRTGLTDVPPFEKLVLIGASLGSVICGAEAAKYADVDAVVLTAYIPVDPTDAVAEEHLRAFFQPAVTRRPELRGLVDDDYVMARADIDGSFLYRNGVVDPTIIEVSEQMAGTTTWAELAGTSQAGPLIRQSKVPTLVLVGEFDTLLFDQRSEADVKAQMKQVETLSPPNFEFQVVADTGHVINLHAGARQAFQQIDNWLDARDVLRLLG